MAVARLLAGLSTLTTPPTEVISFPMSQNIGCFFRCISNQIAEGLLWLQIHMQSKPKTEPVIRVVFGFQFSIEAFLVIRELDRKIQQKYEKNHQVSYLIFLF